MGRDIAIVEAVAAGEVRPTLRLYRWNPPCLSLGRHQPRSAANLPFCRSHGIDVVRRPTGGRAVLHHHELTYALIAPLDGEILPKNLQEAYRRIASGLVAACRAIGIRASLTPGEVNAHLPSPASSSPCFQAPAGGEVAVNGKKIIGSAMRAHRGVVLQHGAWLLDWDAGLQAGATGLPDDHMVRPFLTTVAAELGVIPALPFLIDAISQGMATALGVTFSPGPLSGHEKSLALKRAGDVRISTSESRVSQRTSWTSRAR